MTFPRRPFFGLLSSVTLFLSGAGGHAQELGPGPHFWDPIKPCPSTTAPEEIRDGYWRGQFERVNRAVRQADDCKVVFFGDSITWRWSLGRAEGKSVWAKHFAKYRPINMGNSGDITPVMLYRATHGNLEFEEGREPHVAILLCGTNNYVVTQSDGGKVTWNLGMDTPPKEVAEGILAVAQAFRKESPPTRVILLGILPVKNERKWAKCRETNRILAEHRYPQNEVLFLDLQDRFLTEEGSLKGDLFIDGTHLTTEGYEIMAKALVPEIERLLKLGSVRPGK